VTDACGDKSLRIGRGVRFRRTANPASVLIYISPNASADAPSSASRLQSFLKKAGHRPRVVQGEEQLGEALGSGQFDVVLGNVGEADNLQGRLEASSSRPTLVPVIFKGTKAEVAAAQKQYRHVVKNPNSGDQYLEAIEEVMRARAHARA
jgi:DNA-binding NtrC family response regulator